MADIVSVNGIHQWLVIRWWTNMFDLDTSIHIVGHLLVADCVEELLDWWHFIYATSLIMPVFMIFEFSWLDSNVCEMFPAIMEILIHYISSTFMDIMTLCISSSWRFWSIYIVCGDDHTCHILYHAYSWTLTLMYPRMLYLLAVMCRVWSLYCIDWMDGSSIGFFITPLLGCIYNVFRPSYDPSDLTH